MMLEALGIGALYLLLSGPLRARPGGYQPLPRPPAQHPMPVLPPDPLQDDVSLINTLCVCAIGSIGLVTGRTYVTYPDGSQAWAWVGRSFHGTAWSSRQPKRLAAEDQALLLPLFHTRELCADERRKNQTR